MFSNENQKHPNIKSDAPIDSERNKQRASNEIGKADRISEMAGKAKEHHQDPAQHGDNMPTAGAEKANMARTIGGRQAKGDVCS